MTQVNRRILADLTAKPATPSIEDLMRLIQAQQAQIEAMKKAGPARQIGFKVSEKGCVTMTGTGQFGTTLYASQWAAILDHAPALAAFISANASALSFKTDAQREATLASVKTYLD